MRLPCLPLCVATLMMMSSTSWSLAQTTTPTDLPTTPQTGVPAAQAAGTDAPAAELAEEARSPAIRELDDRLEEQREALNEDYSERIAKLHQQYIDDLAELAATREGTEATEAYRRLFAFAIATDQFDHAEPVARQFLESDRRGGTGLRDLAEYIAMVALAERGESAEAVEELRAYIQAAGDDGAATTGKRAVALAEDLIQRLVQRDAYNLARQIPALFLDQDLEPEIEQHFQARQNQLDLVGRPAPEVSAIDVNNRPFRLSDLRGKVVLMDFWATWCSPCVARMPRLAQLESSHPESDFQVLGVNLDTAREGVEDTRATIQDVRQFLIDARITWPNILGGEGPRNIAQAFGVTSIPSNVLIGRDGTVLAIDLSDDRLDEAIEAALNNNSDNANR